MVKKLQIDDVDLVQFHFTKVNNTLPPKSKLYMHSERLYVLGKVEDESIDLMNKLVFLIKYDTELCIKLFEKLPRLVWLFEVNSGALMNVIYRMNHN